tara:strand:- start:1280 stop:1573 length:294 start_codon:yes stop_codon:yes gene_type:complete
MGQVKNGSRGNWAGGMVETLSGSVTLKPSDSGKVFLCAGATVTLPSAADAGAGWNAKFIFKSGSSSVNSSGAIDTAGDFCEVVCDGSAFYNAKYNAH